MSTEIRRIYGMNQLFRFLLNGWKIASWYAKPSYTTPYRIIVILEYSFAGSKGWASWEI